MISVYFLKLLCIVAEMSGVGEKNASSQRKIYIHRERTETRGGERHGRESLKIHILLTDKQIQF